MVNDVTIYNEMGVTRFSIMPNVKIDKDDLFNIISNAESLSEHRKNSKEGNSVIIEVVGIFQAPIDIPDPLTGEVKKRVSTIFITKDNKSYFTPSDIIKQRVYLLCSAAIHDSPEKWSTPKKLKFTIQQNKMHNINTVSIVK